MSFFTKLVGSKLFTRLYVLHASSCSRFHADLGGKVCVWHTYLSYISSIHLLSYLRLNVLAITVHTHESNQIVPSCAIQWIYSPRLACLLFLFLVALGGYCTAHSEDLSKRWWWRYLFSYIKIGWDDTRWDVPRVWLLKGPEGEKEGFEERNTGAVIWSLRV